MAFELDVSGGKRVRNWLMMAVLAVPGPPTSSEDCAALLRASTMRLTSALKSLLPCTLPTLMVHHARWLAANHAACRDSSAYNGRLAL